MKEVIQSLLEQIKSFCKKEVQIKATLELLLFNLTDDISVVTLQITIVVKHLSFSNFIRMWFIPYNTHTYACVHAHTYTHTHSLPPSPTRTSQNNTYTFLPFSYKVHICLWLDAWGCCYTSVISWVSMG